MKFANKIIQQKLLSVVGLLVFLVCPFTAFSQAVTTGKVTNNANLRAGPATSYEILGKAAEGQTVTIIGQDDSGDWYHLADGQWIAAFLVDKGTSAPLLSPTATKPMTNTVILVPTAVISAGLKTVILVPTPMPTGQATPSPLPTVASIGLPATKTVTALRDANLRGGPSTSYPVTGGVSSGQTLTLTGRNADSSWFQLTSGAWIAAFLLNDGSAPVAVATPTSAPAAPTAAPAPVANGNDFVVVDKHLWDPYENGGSLDGPSVHCGLARELIVNVLDANGNRLNGVAVQVQYGAKEIYVTGSQGKGDGVAEFVLGSGQDVKVARDNDGRAVTSDLVTGLVTNAQFIPYETLIASNYCQDAASCKNFADSYSCEGHFSWTVTFKRQR
ncbi:MAG: SH3 domain-containing protein [Caldilineaceae bacterium]